MHYRGRVAKPFVSPLTPAPPLCLYTFACCVFFRRWFYVTLYQPVVSTIEADVLVKTPTVSVIVPHRSTLYNKRHHRWISQYRPFSLAVYQALPLPFTYNPEQRRFTTSEVAADWQWLQYRGARSVTPEPALTNYWAHSCSQLAYYAPVNHAGSSPRNPCT